MIKSIKQKITEAFMKHGNLTDRDLVKIVNSTGNSIRPKRLDLEREGIIRNTGDRDFSKCKGRGWAIYEFIKSASDKKGFYHGLKRGRKSNIKLSYKKSFCNNELINKVINSLTSLSNVLVVLK
jgi:hypothetical protein